MSEELEILRELQEVKAMLTVLVERQTVKEYYEIEDFSSLVGKTTFTCREWFQLGRINSEKKLSDNGAYARWVVSQAELLRYQKEGLLPYQRPS